MFGLGVVLSDPERPRVSPRERQSIEAGPAANPKIPDRGLFSLSATGECPRAAALLLSSPTWGFSADQVVWLIRAVSYEERNICWYILRF